MLTNRWIIGASSGIGLELVKLWLKEDNCLVIASSRNATQNTALLQLKHAYNDTLTLLDIDVTSTHSVDTAVTIAIETLPTIDLILYNAGIYEAMKVSQWNLQHFAAMNETNYMGAIRLLSALQPHFESLQPLRVVFNASISSYFGLPYAGGYSAPKAALMNFAQSIQPELYTKNIEIQIINHGFVQSRLTDKNDFSMPQLMSTHDAANTINRALQTPYRFEIRFPKMLTGVLSFLRFLPSSVAFYLTKKAL